MREAERALAAEKQTKQDQSEQGVSPSTDGMATTLRSMKARYFALEETLMHQLLMLPAPLEDMDGTDSGYTRVSQESLARNWLLASYEPGRVDAEFLHRSEQSGYSPPATLDYPPTPIDYPQEATVDYPQAPIDYPQAVSLYPQQPTLNSTQNSPLESSQGPGTGNSAGGSPGSSAQDAPEDPAYMEELLYRELRDVLRPLRDRHLLEKHARRVHWKPSVGRRVNPNLYYLTGPLAQLESHLMHLVEDYLHSVAPDIIPTTLSHLVRVPVVEACADGCSEQPYSTAPGKGPTQGHSWQSAGQGHLRPTTTHRHPFLRGTQGQRPADSNAQAQTYNGQKSTGEPSEGHPQMPTYGHLQMWPDSRATTQVPAHLEGELHVAARRGTIPVERQYDPIAPKQLYLAGVKLAGFAALFMRHEMDMLDLPVKFFSMGRQYGRLRTTFAPPMGATSHPMGATSHSMGATSHSMGAYPPNWPIPEVDADEWLPYQDSVVALFAMCTSPVQAARVHQEFARLLSNLYSRMGLNWVLVRRAADSLTKAEAARTSLFPLPPPSLNQTLSQNPHPNTGQLCQNDRGEWCPGPQSSPNGPQSTLNGPQESTPNGPQSNPNGPRESTPNGPQSTPNAMGVAGNRCPQLVELGFVSSHADFVARRLMTRLAPPSASSAQESTPPSTHRLLYPHMVLFLACSYRRPLEAYRAPSSFRLFHHSTTFIKYQVLKKRKFCFSLFF